MLEILQREEKEAVRSGSLLDFMRFCRLFFVVSTFTIQLSMMEIADEHQRDILKNAMRELEK